MKYIHPSLRNKRSLMWPKNLFTSSQNSAAKLTMEIRGLIALLKKHMLHFSKRGFNHYI